MADTKISGLPASTVPLAGTEVLPIVQSSTTKQVSIANVTAGRDVSALSVATTKDTTPSSSVGAFSYGTLNYADVNHLATFQTSVASYAQVEIQNTSTDPAASSDMVVGNSLTTASTYYGDFGMNSSGWVGSTPFNTANNVYLTSTTADLALGTTTANAIRFATNTIERARIFSSGGVSIGNSTDPGATNLSVTGTITQANNSPTAYTIFQTGIPFVLCSSGSMGNNGALSGLTAMQETYAKAYVYMPASAISAGSSAGWYYAVFSSTSAGTVYNNVYTTGVPAVPASPTAFVTTGPGAFVQTTAQITGVNFTIPGNSFGINGGFSYYLTAALPVTAGVKLINPYYNTSGVHQGNNSQNIYYLTEYGRVVNRGVTNKQLGSAIPSNSGQFAGIPQGLSIDSTIDRACGMYMQIATIATDYLVLDNFIVEINP